MAKIKKIVSREILDSRGIPTVEACLTLDTEISVTAAASSGESIGEHEAKDLRDGDAQRFQGRGVLKAVSFINDLIAPKLVGVSCDRQIDVDYWLMKVDPSPTKTQFGVNSLLTVSQLLLKAAAADARLPLYKYVNQFFNKLFNNPFDIQKIPSPIFNMINGGKHGVKNLEFQEFQIIPLTSIPFSKALQMGAEMYHEVKKTLEYRNAGISVSEEGGFTPNLLTNHDALDLLKETITDRKLMIGVDIFLGLDLASSYFYKDGKYYIKDKAKPLKIDEYIDFLVELNKTFKILILEDAIEQEDFLGWKKMTQKTGSDTYIIGDDFLAGSKERVLRAIKENACSGLLLKLNQTSTITELFEVINLAKQGSLKVIFSQRLGETNDDFIADVAVGIQSDFIKFGPPVRGERVAKYNRLLAIEEELRQQQPL